MNTIQMNFAKWGLNSNQILSRADMKRIIGGQENPGGDEGATACLGCATDNDCTAVGKGPKCTKCAVHKKYCCDGWHND
jgi:hypothetical protein